MIALSSKIGMIFLCEDKLPVSVYFTGDLFKTFEILSCESKNKEAVVKYLASTIFIIDEIKFEYKSQRCIQVGSMIYIHGYLSAV